MTMWAAYLIILHIFAFAGLGWTIIGIWLAIMDRKPIPEAHEHLSADHCETAVYRPRGLRIVK